MPGGMIRGMELTVMRRDLYKIAVFHNRIVSGDPNSYDQHAFRLLLSEKGQHLRNFVHVLLKQLAQWNRLLHVPY